MNRWFDGKGALGGDPLVVRIGLSTLHFVKAEAACILLEKLIFFLAFESRCMKEAVAVHFHATDRTDRIGWQS